ncbi:secretin N-terminal domain-containing protein [Curvibacter gracilis]|uniref:secretin N-terminal domain-containing protein n=1 Tax=Curvibacter gracilis TaxID=230310 RepID=UPI0004B11949|nr:secretin N-terminal domain-containing protein [Curvibacter gracilis]
MTPRLSLLATAALLTLLQGTAPAWAGTVARPKSADPANRAGAERTLTLNFSNADLESVARAMAVITGRQILLDARVKGNLSLTSEDPMTPSQAWSLWASALRLQGYVVVESGGVYRVLPEADGKLQSASVVAGAEGPRDDRIVTRVFKLSHESASNLVPVLRPLISPNNVINLNPGNNALVITDYASNLARLATLIESLDAPSGTDVEIIALEHAVASDLVSTLQRLGDSQLRTASAGAAAQAGTVAAGGSASGSGNGGTASATAGLSIMVDQQSNSLLVRAANPEQMAFVRSLAARLDRPNTGVGVHVVHLQNADATKLATVLRAAFPSADSSRSTGSYGSSNGSTGLDSAGGFSSSMTSGSSSASTSSSGSKGSSSPSVSASAQPSTGGGIQADPSTNSLILTASEPRFREMRKVIDQLDAPRAQLYVESLVVEVDASKSMDLGVQWSQLFSISSSTTLTLGTIASALETMSGTNILSTANVITLDNEEAKIVVGQNVPFVTGSYTTTSSTTSSPFQTIERKDVGITLKIKPQIGENGNVRLTIYQESSSVAATTAAGTTNAGPTTNKRSIESTVTVKNGKIIVLGGLIEDSATSDAGQVPVVADIPVLGAMFRSLSKSRKKTNLMVFLRPRVVTDDEGSEALSTERRQALQARQRELPTAIRDVLIPETQPAWPQGWEQPKPLSSPATLPLQPQPAGG